MINPSNQALLDKILQLPPHAVSEVEDFVDFLLLYYRDRQLVQASKKLSETAFQQVWDNPDDAEYDQL
ncbi:MAG: toxin-antitoxin system, antitoxin component, Xre family protein [Synechococcales bacterium]|nr:toxin-antitoxin system, antitoxin component, Xre family protein [Synechococcales bacterium]